MTTAGQPGSLVEQEACSAISFDSARPALWDIPVPTDGDPVTSPPLTGCGKDGCPSGLEPGQPTATAGPSSQPVVEPTTSAPSPQPVVAPTPNPSSKPTVFQPTLAPGALIPPTEEPSQNPSSSPTSDQSLFELAALIKPTGCLIVRYADASEDQKLKFGECGDLDNAWRYDNGLFRSELDRDMCMQAGRGGEPEHGKKMRLFPCDMDNDLQQFDFSETLGTIKLKSYDLLCVEFRGTHANVGDDPIILKNCTRSVSGWTREFIYSSGSRD